MTVQALAIAPVAATVAVAPVAKAPRKAAPKAAPAPLTLTLLPLTSAGQMQKHLKTLSLVDALSFAVNAANNAEKAGQYAFLAWVGMYLHIGADETRKAQLEAFPDRKSPQAQYFNRILTLCKGAASAGNAAGISKVRTFKELVALAPKKQDNGRTGIGADAEGGAPGVEGEDGEKAAPADKAPKKARSMAADIMAAFDALETIAAQAKTLSLNKKASATAMRELLATVATMAPAEVAKLKAAFSATGQ